MDTNHDRGLPYVQKLGFRVARNVRAAQSILEKKVGLAKAKECGDWFNKRAEDSHDNSIESENEFYAFKNSSLPLSMAISEIFDADYIRRICSWLDNNKEYLGSKILDIGCDNGIITCFIAQTCPEAKVIGIDRCKESIISAQLLAKQMNLTNVEFICDSAEKYPVKGFDTVIALRISQENVKIPTFNVYDSFYNISTIFKDALMQHSKSLLSHLSEGGNLITGQLTDLNYYFFGQMLCYADMGWFPEQIDQLLFTSYENEVTLSITVCAKQEHNDIKLPEDFAEGMQEQEKMPFMQPYYANFSNLISRINMVEALSKPGMNFTDSIYYGWKANLYLEDNADDLIIGYNIYYRNNDNPQMYSLWKNAKDTTAVFYFGASHVFLDNEANQPDPCWANMDISSLEQSKQSLLEFIINAGESGMIRKICTLKVTDEGKIIEIESSIEEITQSSKTKQYHDLRKSSGLADFLRESIEK